MGLPDERHRHVLTCHWAERHGLCRLVGQKHLWTRSSIRWRDGYIAVEVHYGQLCHLVSCRKWYNRLCRLMGYAPLRLDHSCEWPNGDGRVLVHNWRLRGWFAHHRRGWHDLLWLV